MLTGLQGVGWLLRRTPDRARLGDFYRAALNLPQVRLHGETPVFWLGETVVLGVNPGGRVLAEPTDPREYPMIPVLYVTALDRITAGMRDQGVRFLGDTVETDGGKRAYFLDIDNNVMALEERDAASTHPQDVLAAERGFNNTIPFTLPDGFVRLGRVVVHCRDLAAETAFYRDVAGLPVIAENADRVELALGELIVLELAPGNLTVEMPKDRDEVNTAIAIRVVDVNAAAAALRDRGVQFVNEPFDIGGGRVGYFVDPEGHTVGIQTRLESSERVEDAEARRRVAAGMLAT